MARGQIHPTAEPRSGGADKAVMTTPDVLVQDDGANPTCSELDLSPFLLSRSADSIQAAAAMTSPPASNTPTPFVLSPSESTVDVVATPNNYGEDHVVNTPPTEMGSMDSSSITGGTTPVQAVQPVLYSAIGSLENSSLTNMGSFQSRIYKASATTTSTTSAFSSATRISKSTLLPPSYHSTLSGNKQQQEELAFQTGVSTKTTTKAFYYSERNTSKTSNLQKKKTGLVSALETHAAAQVATHATDNNAKEGSLETITTPQQQQTASDLDQEGIKEKSPLNKQQESGEETSEQQQAPPDVVLVDSQQVQLESILKKPQHVDSKEQAFKKNVSIDADVSQKKPKATLKKKQTTTTATQMEVFRPSCDAYTPRLPSKGARIPPYLNPEARKLPVEAGVTSTMGTISRPNFRDALKRVAMILHQHILKIEQRFDDDTYKHKTLFSLDMKDLYSEQEYVTPRYKCTVMRAIPMSMPGVVITKKEIPLVYKIPTSDEIYEFAHQLFKKVQLSSECSIVCLIYVERLMEVAKVPLLAQTWRPIFMCGLLLASKVWQDLSSWNIEFASVYPQFSLEAINKLELRFVSHIKWDLYIGSSLYAKYYFALRSLMEKKDFRQRYNRMVGVDNVAATQEAFQVQQRTEMVKEEALMLLSQSM